MKKLILIEINPAIEKYLENILIETFGIEKVTELTTPTDEEISLEADKYYMAIPKSDPKRNCDISFMRGAKWTLKRLGL